MNRFVLLSSASLTALAPVVLIKEYINTDNYWYLFLTIMCYIILMVLYIEIFKISEISSSYTLLQVVQIFIITMIGLFIYHESRDIKKLSGIIMAVLATYLLS